MQDPLPHIVKWLLRPYANLLPSKNLILDIPVSTEQNQTWSMSWTVLPTVWRRSSPSLHTSHAPASPHHLHASNKPPTFTLQSPCPHCFLCLECPPQSPFATFLELPFCSSVAFWMILSLAHISFCFILPGSGVNLFSPFVNAGSPASPLPPLPLLPGSTGLLYRAEQKPLLHSACGPCSSHLQNRDGTPWQRLNIFRPLKR